MKAATSDRLPFHENNCWPTLETIACDEPRIVRLLLTEMSNRYKQNRRNTTVGLCSIMVHSVETACSYIAHIAGNQRRYDNCNHDDVSHHIAFIRQAAKTLPKTACIVQERQATTGMKSAFIDARTEAENWPWQTPSSCIDLSESRNFRPLTFSRKQLLADFRNDCFHPASS